MAQVTAVAQIRSLAWEHLHATGVAIKKKNSLVFHQLFKKGRGKELEMTISLKIENKTFKIQPKEIKICK